MGKVRSTDKILDYAPNFYSGMMAIFRPGRKYLQLRKTVRAMSQNDGLYADMSWQRK